MFFKPKPNSRVSSFMIRNDVQKAYKSTIYLVYASSTMNFYIGFDANRQTSMSKFVKYAIIFILWSTHLMVDHFDHRRSLTLAIPKEICIKLDTLDLKSHFGKSRNNPNYSLRMQ